jgi:hypothetical protein
VQCTPPQDRGKFWLLRCRNGRFPCKFVHWLACGPFRIWPVSKLLPWLSTCCLRRAAHSVPSPPLLSRLTAPSYAARRVIRHALTRIDDRVRAPSAVSPLKSEVPRKDPQNGRTFRRKSCLRALRLSEPARGARSLWCALSTRTNAEILEKCTSRDPHAPAERNPPRRATTRTSPRTSHVLCFQSLPFVTATSHQRAPQPRVAADATPTADRRADALATAATIAPCLRARSISSVKERVGAHESCVRGRRRDTLQKRME